jgi:hypothetical protein
VPAPRSAAVELGRLSFAEHSLESVVGRVTELAAHVLPREAATSVTIVHRRPVTAAGSHQLATALDVVQYRLGAGPCLSAATTGRPAAIADTRAPSDWTEFATTAAEQGCGSVLSYPLPLPPGTPGALNVYLPGAALDGEQTKNAIDRFATSAVVPVANAYLYRSAVDRAEQLRAALASRAVIDQAKGILMERFKLTADRAFDVLARVSMERNTKVRDLAQQVVATGEFPGA